MREKGSSGSGLSESRCSFLFRAFVSPNQRRKRREDRQEGRRIEGQRDRGEKKTKGRLDKVIKV